MVPPNRPGRWFLCCIVAAIAGALCFGEYSHAQPGIIDNVESGQIEGVIIDGAIIEGSIDVEVVEAEPAESETSEEESAESEPAESEDESTDSENSEGDNGEEATAEDSGDTVKRPNKPPRVPDPREFDIEPDKNGRVRFAFNGQSWPDVLQWLASASNMSLDWQELPKGYLNLSTERSYTMPEARDLVNRHLQQRGYTLLVQGEVMSIMKLEALDPSLVPRVKEEDLYDRQPHEIVKLTFELPESIEVAKAAEDFKQALSPNAKILPLASTKRLLIIDTVTNLRLISELLNSERLEGTDRVVPREFVLRFARAERVIDICYVVLGMDPAAQPSQMELQVQQQKMQLLMQMQQTGVDVGRMLNPDKAPVFLAFNPQRNSILVNAPAPQLKIIEQTIQLLDVPAAGTEAAQSTAAGGDSARRLEKYELTTVDPQQLVKTLSEIGNLSPLADLRADSGAKVLFARATGSDHSKIKQMIDQLDGPELETAVYQLRKHPADAVAGTIKALFEKGEEEDDNNSSRGYYSYWDYGYYNQPSSKPKSSLKIDADVENNRLLVRGNSKQISQVEEFLIKIGENPRGQRELGGVRVIESLDRESAAAVLKQLRATWNNEANGPLMILGPDNKPLDAERDQEKPQVEPDVDDPQTSVKRPRFFLAADPSSPDDAPSAPPQPPAKPPLVIKLTPDGRIVMTGSDSADLDRIEQFINAAAPPATRFKVFELKYVRAFSVWLNLREVYEDEMKSKTSSSGYDYYSGYYREAKEETMQLSRRNKLKIVYDTPTNTILVANASPAQLYEIENLVKSYDQPAPTDTYESRRTEAIKLKYARANKVAAALREVYRDLLSTRDKEFDSEEKKGGGISIKRTTVIRYGGGDGESGELRETKPVRVGFQGAFSVGVDEVSNVLIVSAQDELFDSILNVVKILDEEARPKTTVSVRAVGSGVSAEAIKRALGETLGTQWQGGLPKQQQPASEQSEDGDRSGPREVSGPDINVVE